MTGFTPINVTLILWGLWAVSWLAAAVWASRAQARSGALAETMHRIPTVVGAVFLMLTWPQGERRGWFADRIPFEPASWREPIWRLPEVAAWACVALTLAGFAFMWWARLHLGTLWSGSITRKADHHIVDTGPYGLVRHPIYTGLILATVMMAVEKGSFGAFLGGALMIFGFWLKARTEERFLSVELGEEAYAGYRKRVPMLVPFVRV